MRALAAGALGALWGLTIVLVGCSGAKELPVELRGEGKAVAGPFALRGGYYIVEGELKSGASGQCRFGAGILGFDGRDAYWFASPLADNGGRVTWQSEDHWIAGGDYRLRVDSDCGEWRVEIQRQALFDEESRAKAEGRPKFLLPGLLDSDEYRNLPPPVVMQGAPSAVPQPSLRATVRALPEVLVRASTTGAGVERVNVEEGRVLYVAVDAALLRAEPSGGVRAILDPGGVVMLRGGSAVGEGHQWVEVAAGDLTGWVAADLLSATPPPPANPTPTLTPTPVLTPIIVPTVQPTGLPPTVSATQTLAAPTEVPPTAEPPTSTPEPTAEPTAEPEMTETPTPTAAPATAVPATAAPAPTSAPTAAPTAAPTETTAPPAESTQTVEPTSTAGTVQPTNTSGTAQPTSTSGGAQPTGTSGTAQPTGTTGTAQPTGTTGTAQPTSAATTAPTSALTTAPTSGATAAPTSGATAAPTGGATSAPTTAPTAAPTSAPTSVPPTSPPANTPVPLPVLR